MSMTSAIPTIPSGGLLTSGPTTPPVLANQWCRDRSGYFSEEVFNYVACAMCFRYIYVTLDVSFNETTSMLVAGVGLPSPPGTTLYADVEDEGSVETVCGWVDGGDSCWKWKDCCRKARDCCTQQMEAGRLPMENYGVDTCPRTWDGYHCFEDTPSHTTTYFNCPAYVPNSGSNSNKAFRECGENGTWYQEPVYNSEWTDYRPCHDLTKFKQLHVAGLACNIITIILLVPACFIFLYFKQLRQQHRIRLHLCLMVSSLFNSLAMLLWEVIIFRDRLYTVGDDSVMVQNSVPCRILNVATRYFLMANFMWMFIEGFHLHRLLVHAFSSPKSLLPYYIFGFGFPWIPILVYMIIRVAGDDLNQKCWVEEAGAFEWILYTPILIVLVVNVFFLLRIVFIMIKQLEPHPNEPSNFRRAAKAVGVLVPLFGVQFILFVYRPRGSDFAEFYELLNKIVSSLQGSFVAIVFCYCNKEVQTHLKALCGPLLNRRGHLRGHSLHGGSFTMTSYHTDTTRTRLTNGSGDGSHIPMQRVGWQEENGENTFKQNNHQNTSLLDK